MATAVIFDCDGVLVDSEVIVTRIESAMLAELGAMISVEQIVTEFTGLSDTVMAERLRLDYGVELPATFDADRRRRSFAAFDAELVAVPGIGPVLEGLAGGGVPVAVASSSAPDRIARSLALTALDGYFGDHVYSASMVPNGKPAPDLFLHAAAQLGVAPADCVVIEDARPGVQAGVAAGMHVIGFTAAGHCIDGHADRLTGAGAHTVAATGPELAATLGDLLGAR